MTDKVTNGFIPKLLDIRWVCPLCLNILHAPLKINWKGVTGSPNTELVPTNVKGPECHGTEMLILGEPKIDLFGLRSRGATIDPYNDMICPKLAKPK